MRSGFLARLALLIGLSVPAAFLLSCDQALSSDGSWTASPRVSAGVMTDSQLARSTWVRAEAWRSGTLLAYGEAPYDDHSLQLTIPSPGSVQVVLYGYGSDAKDTLMWSGSATVKSGASTVSTDTVVLLPGPGLAQDTTLASLETVPGVLVGGFDPADTGYVVYMALDAAQMKIRAVPTDPRCAVTFDGSTDSVVALVSDTSRVEVEVTNGSGNSLVYALTVIRRETTGTAIDTLLSSLSTEPGVLGTAFSSGTTAYVDTVPYGATSVLVRAVPVAESGVWVTYDGSRDSVVELSGTGSSTLAVVVHNENGNSLEYELTVVRRASTALLASLTLDGQKPGNFLAGTYDYTAVVGADDSALAVVAVPENTGATVTIHGPDADGSPVALAIGNTTFTVGVRNGYDTATYTVTVHRPAWSEDASLVPAARLRGGVAVQPFLDTLLSATGEGAVWWGVDSNALRAYANPVWIDRDVELLVRVVKNDSVRGPLRRWRYIVSDSIGFDTLDTRIYPQSDENLKTTFLTAGVYGWGWATNSEQDVSQLIQLTPITNDRTYEHISVSANSVAGEYTTVGIGFLLNQVPDSSGSFQDTAHVDLTGLSAIRLASRYRQHETAGTNLFLMLLSAADSGCAETFSCLQVAFEPDEMDLWRSDTLSLGDFAFPDYRTLDEVSKADILSQATGVALMVAGGGSESIAEAIDLDGIRFVLPEAAAPSVPYDALPAQ